MLKMVMMGNWIMYGLTLHCTDGEITISTIHAMKGWFSRIRCLMTGIGVACGVCPWCVSKMYSTYEM